VILLDTNVLSELMKPVPDQTVLRFVNGIPGIALFTSAITQAEILYGIALLPEGKRRDALLAAARTALDNHFRGRVLPFDGGAAEAFAAIAAGRRESGRPISQADAQIAAIAKSRGAALATRNVSDFDGCGVRNVAVAAVRPRRSVLSDSSRNAAPVVASSLTSSGRSASGLRSAVFSMSIEARSPSCSRSAAMTAT